MRIRQMQVRGENVQDRLLLRIAAQDDDEYRIHFTRRFLRELWPHLINMLAGHLAARPAQISAEDTAAATDGETTASGPRYDQDFKNDNPRFPLGSQPLLASEASLLEAGPGKAQLVLREGRERSVTLNLDHDLMHGLCAMLRATAEKARWDLQLDYASVATPTPDIVLASDKPHLLH